MYYQACVEVVGYVECKYRDWFDENDPEINQLPQVRDQAHEKHLGASEKRPNSVAFKMLIYHCVIFVNEKSVVARLL